MTPAVCIFQAGLRTVASLWLSGEPALFRHHVVCAYGCFLRPQLLECPRCWPRHDVPGRALQSTTQNTSKKLRRCCCCPGGSIGRSSAKPSTDYTASVLECPITEGRRSLRFKDARIACDPGWCSQERTALAAELRAPTQSLSRTTASAAIVWSEQFATMRRSEACQAATLFGGGGANNPSQRCRILPPTKPCG